MPDNTAISEGTKKRLANLKPFKKGQSGNPAGRPPGSVSVKAELQKLVNIMLKNEHNPLSDEVEAEMPVGRKIALNLAVDAAEGNPFSINRVMEYLDGKPHQTSTTELTGKDGGPVQLESASNLSDEQLNAIAAIAKGSSHG